MTRNNSKNQINRVHHMEIKESIKLLNVLIFSQYLKHIFLEPHHEPLQDII